MSPTLTGAIFDSTGSYDLALVMPAPALAAAFVLFHFASRLSHPAEAGQASAPA